MSTGHCFYQICFYLYSGLSRLIYFVRVHVKHAGMWRAKKKFNRIFEKKETGLIKNKNKA